MSLHPTRIGDWTPAQLQRFILNNVLSDPASVPKPKTVLPPMEPWRDVTATDYSSPWTNFDGGPVYRPAKYLKHMGFVAIRGLVTGGAGGANGQTIFTLPEGYRPVMVNSTTVGMVFRVAAYNGVNAVFGSVEIHGDGRVTPYSNNPFGVGTGLWLDGIIFPAA